MDNMTIFDFIESEHRFAPIIDNLSADISKIFSNKELNEEYEIWEHVPHLGYRYFVSVSVSEKEWERVIESLEKIKEEYVKKELEISIRQSPSFKTNEAKLHISTIWKNKKRAKNG